MNGQISIVRPGACDDREIRMTIRLAMGKTITALITRKSRISINRKVRPASRAKAAKC